MKKPICFESNMFCDEPIKKVFKLELKEDLQPKWCNSLLQITYKFEYHTTYGLWYLFETENFYITVGYDGVVKYQKPYEFSNEQYEIDIIGDGETPCYEDLIFAGQHICSVEEKGNCTLISFDNFSWKLYVYGENDEKWFKNRSYGRGDEIVPVGVHLLNKCSCGGNPEIYFDHVDDFFVRCSSCHASTYSDMWFKESMDAWNRGETPISSFTTNEYFEKTVSTQKIKRIVVSNRYLEMCEEDSCWADEIIFEFENTRIGVRNTRIGEDFSKFVFSNQITNYKQEIYSHVIQPTFGEIKYLDLYEIYGDEEMTLVLDDTKLTISTNGQELFLSLAEPHENNFVVAKRDKLFC